MSNRTKLNITPDVILRAYMLGVFPMAETKESKEIFWVDPESRGMLPFENFHISKSLVKTVKKAVSTKKTKIEKVKEEKVVSKKTTTSSFTNVKK